MCGACGAGALHERRTARDACLCPAPYRRARAARRRRPTAAAPAPRLRDAAPWLTPATAFLHHDGSPSWELLRGLRAAAASPAERKAHGAALACGARVSRAGDARVAQWLVDACLLQLASLPSSAEQDAEELAGLRAARAGGARSEGAAYPGTEMEGGQACCSALTMPTDASPVLPTSAAHLPCTGPSCLELAIQLRLSYKRWAPLDGLASAACSLFGKPLALPARL